MSSECIVVVVSVIKSACFGLLFLSTCHFQRKRFSSFEYFCYQLHSKLSSPFRLHSTCRAEINLFFYYSFATNFVCTLLHFRGDEFFKKQFFSLPLAEKTFRIKFLVHSTLTGVLFCFVFTLESFFGKHKKKFSQQRGKAEENFNVFPTNTGATFRRAEILFAAACFFLPFQIVNRFFSGENLICLFRHYSVYFSPHRSARLEIDSITQN